MSPKTASGTLVIYGIEISLYSEQLSMAKNITEVIFFWFSSHEEDARRSFQTQPGRQWISAFFQRFLVIKVQCNRKNYVQIVLPCTRNNIIGLSGEFTQRKISSQQVLDKRGAKTCSTAL